MKRTLTALALAATLAACSSPEPAERPGGDPAVYERIAAESDCAKLQEKFDWAKRTHDQLQDPVYTEYMAATDDRMREVGCY